MQKSQMGAIIFTNYMDMEGFSKKEIGQKGLRKRYR